MEIQKDALKYLIESSHKTNDLLLKTIHRWTIIILAIMVAFTIIITSTVFCYFNTSYDYNTINNMQEVHQ